MLVLFELIADILAKEWSTQVSGYLWVVALAAYIIGNAFWLLALKNGAELSRGVIIFSIMSEVLAILIGVLLYKEVLTPLQWTGIVFGFVSLVMILW
jgi:drug/metabolite transporter (DMT)-like permease